MDINGVWKGEYIIQRLATSAGKEIPVPFVLKITPVGKDGLIVMQGGLFEGICQDDPTLTKINVHATIYGSRLLNSIYFVKQYPKLLVRTNTGEIESFDGTHPEIHYRGEYHNDLFSGSWNMYRTFRKINGTLSELHPMQGTWWMRKA